MVLQLPRLTNSLRDPFDIDRAYLHRKSILQNLNQPRYFSLLLLLIHLCYLLKSCIIIHHYIHWAILCLIISKFTRHQTQLLCSIQCVLNPKALIFFGGGLNCSSAKSLDESELARKIVCNWEEGTSLLYFYAVFPWNGVCSSTIWTGTVAFCQLYWRELEFSSHQLVFMKLKELLIQINLDYCLKTKGNICRYGWNKCWCLWSSCTCFSSKF